MRLRYLWIAPLVALALLGVAPSPASAKAGLPPDTATAGAVTVAARGVAATAVVVVRIVSGQTSWGLGVTHCGRGNAYQTGGVVVRSPNGARRDPAHIWPGDTAMVTCARSTAPVAASTTTTSRRWVSPLASYRITTCYEWRRALYVNGVLISKAGLHEGLDMSAPGGTRVGAVAAGRVIRVGWRGGYGRAVEVAHGGGITSMYAHLSSIAVVYGQQVGAGDMVGRVGTSGNSTGNHLHLGMYRYGSDFNPTPYLEARGVPIYGC